MLMLLTKKWKACKCGYWSHQRTTSLQCPMNPAYATASSDVIDDLIRNAERQAAMDTLGPQQECLASKLNYDNLDD